jgi:acyl carrier protein
LNKKIVLDKIRPIFKNIFDDQSLNINEESNSENVAGWDSLNHILLIIEIEKKINIKFSSGEISSYKDVGEMCEAITKKLN